MRWPCATLFVLSGCSLLDLDDLDRGTASTTTVSSSTGVGTTSAATSGSAASSGTGGAAGCGELTDCSGACVDLTSNPTSCGQCGRYCEQGACIDGACQPVLLWRGPQGVNLRSTGVALTDDEVIWNSDSDVLALPKGASPGARPRRITDVRGARIAVVDDAMFLSGWPMVKVGIANGEPLTTYAAACRHEVAFSAPYVFCSDTEFGVRRFDEDGGNPSFVQEISGEYSAVVVIGDYVYYQGPEPMPPGPDRQLLKRPRYLDFDAESVFSGAELRGGLAAVDDHVYALGPDGLWDIDVTAETGQKIMTTEGAIGMIAADARAVYVTQWGTGYVLRKSLDGGEDARFLTPAQHTDVIAMDDTRVFFTDHTGNALYRMVR